MGECFARVSRQSVGQFRIWKGVLHTKPVGLRALARKAKDMMKEGVVGIEEYRIDGQ
jgi:hypothetical protein